MTLLLKIFPFIGWFKDYDMTKARIDGIAGLTVALVLIPQSMAYAQLAGLPAYYGLYAAFLPPMIASLFGSSRQLATGPVAVVSLMSAASLEPLATAGSAEFIAYSIVLALVVGIFQFSLGVLKLGLVVNFLSHPVVNGFTNAAAIIIASSQFSKFFGVYVDKAPHHYETMIRVAQAALDYTHVPTLLYGIGAVSIMVILKKINPRIPNVLVAVVITTLISYFSGYQNDVKSPVSSIQMVELPSMITKFNNAVTEVNNLGDQRADVGKKADTLEKGGNSHDHSASLELINLHSQISIFTAQMEQAKARVSDARTQIRALKFKAQDNKGTYTFYPLDSSPENDMIVSGTWRIKVGAKQLSADNLLVMGGGAVVGKIPEGLPVLSIPNLGFDSFLKLLPTAIIISLLGFMEAIAIAKAMAAKTGQKLDPNQELIGQGLANICGSIGQSYACSGSFSRSAVNLQAGAISGVSSVVTSLVVVITLLFLTPLLYHLPQAVLAAVIMMAVIGLVNVSGFVHAWHAQKYDGIISVLTFIVTLAYAPHLDKGIMVGVALSMIVFLYKSMRPVVAQLARTDNDGLGDSQRLNLKGCRHIAAIRFDGSLFFANASYLDDQVAKIRTEMSDVRYILLDGSGINDMDASGEEALALLIARIRAAKLGFAMSHVKESVISVLQRTHLYEKIGHDNFYPDAKTAIKEITRIIHTNSDLNPGKCPNCPLMEFIPLSEATE